MFKFITSLVVAIATACDSSRGSADCFGNGDCDDVTRRCVCDPGWTGAECTVLHLGSVDIAALGYQNRSNPTWGGTAVEHEGTWHMYMGGNYPGNGTEAFDDFGPAHVIHAVSSGGPSGPYFYLAEVRAEHPEQLAKPDLGLRADVHRAPNGSLVLITSGKLEKQQGIVAMVSASGDPAGPWQPHLVFQCMPMPEPDSTWNQGCNDPSAVILANGSMLVTYRTDPKKGADMEHIGLLFADHWSRPARPLTTDSTGPLFNAVAKNEDPYIWQSPRGMHMLVHSQSDLSGQKWTDKKVRGAVAFCPGDGTNVSAWRISEAPAWEAEVRWTNGTSSMSLRRQRPSLIFQRDSGGGLRPTHLITGVNFVEVDHRQRNFDMTLVQPIVLSGATLV